MKILVVAVLVAGCFVAVDDAAAQVRRSSPGRTAGPPDEVVCRRQLRTGTLAAYDRVCRTRGEWQREQDRIRSMNTGETCRANGFGGVVCGQ